MKKILASATLIVVLNTNAVLGPIPIYLDTEYRTVSPVIGSIASTLSFDADDIQASGASTFLDFLATVPSVGLHNPQGNVPAVFIRGNEAKHALVLVDGVSINDISSPDGAVGNGLSNIGLNDVEKIDIIKGTHSVLYGSQAISGVIAITTKKGAEGVSSTIGVKYGTHQAKTYRLLASGGNHLGFVRFAHRQYKTTGFNARVNDTTQDADGINNQTTKIKFGNEYFDITHLQSNDETEYDRCWTGATTVDDCLSDRGLTQTTININKKINYVWNAKLSLAQTKSQRDTQHGTIFTVGDKHQSSNITLLNDINIDDALWVVGLSELTDENTSLQQTLSSQEVFANWQKNINGTDLSAGARYLNHSKFGGHTVYNLAAAKQFSQGIKLTGSYGTGFKAPTLYQFNGSNTTNPTIDPNSNLTPETSKHIELGLEKQQSWGLIGMKVYSNKIKDIVDYVNVSCSDGSSVTYPAPTFVATCTTGVLVNPIYKNEDQLTTKGVALFADITINDYHISFNHNYNQSQQTGESTQSLRRPKNITELSANKHYDRLYFNAQIVKKSATIESNNQVLNGYTLLNINTSYQINKQAKTSFNIKNVTDRHYVPATDFNGDFNSAGRVLEIGLNYQF